jgi:DNA-3-methyladenine glycosylase
MRTLAPDFYARPVLEVARDLVGCTVAHGACSGVIVETEAYHQSEPACHAYVGVTPRTSTLFGPPGRAYVYRSYGIHALFNAVCEDEGVGAAVLIRALEPLAGVGEMHLRRAARAGRPLREAELCSGPGRLTQALGIALSDNACDLARGPVVIAEPTGDWHSPQLVAGARVGISRAAELPWRFCARGNPHVSRPVPRG